MRGTNVAGGGGGCGRAGKAGRAGRAVTERNPRKKKYRARWDTSRLTGANNASNRIRNNYVCEL
jgi:hypothetical protein